MEQIQLSKSRQADDGSFEAYVLYRYPQEALTAERARQAREGNAVKPPGKRGRLKLQVDRSDALVIVDGYPLAVTTANEPIDVEVPAGVFVSTELTQFETIRAVRKYFISPGAAEVRDVKMIERPGFVTVTAEPVGTVVESDEGSSITLPSSERIRLSVGKHVLTFRKAGYESKNVPLVIQRDRIIAVPKVVLLSSEEKLRRLADPPWVLEAAPIGTHYGTIAGPSVGSFTYGASLDRHLFGPLRLRVGYFRGSGSNEQADGSNLLAAPIVTDTISSSFIEVGLPIQAFAISALQTLFVEPVWTDANHSVGGMNVNAKVSQQGIGGAISFRQYFEPGDDSVAVIGFGARVNLTDYYSTSDGLGGKFALSICFAELLIGI